MKTMIMNKKHILSPNSEFERREELARLLSRAGYHSEDELEILRSCTTEDHESIGMIGCLLKDNSPLNMSRLILASLNNSNTELSGRAKTILNKTGQEINEIIDDLALRFSSGTVDLPEYENRVYSILFSVLAERER